MNGISLSPPLSNGTCIITEFSAKTLEGKGRFRLLLLLLFSFRLLFDELETAAATTTTRARDPPSGAAYGKQHFFFLHRDESFVFCLLTPGELLLFFSVCRDNFFPIRSVLFIDTTTNKVLQAEFSPIVHEWNANVCRRRHFLSFFFPWIIIVII